MTPEMKRAAAHIQRTLDIIAPKERLTWWRVYTLCFFVVFSRDEDERNENLDVLADLRIEMKSSQGFRSVERSRTVTLRYAMRRCGYFNA